MTCVNILVCTLQGSYFILMYLCYLCIKSDLNYAFSKTLLWIQTFECFLDLIFVPLLGVQGKVMVCFLLGLLLLFLLMLPVFFTKLLFFCNAYRSYPLFAKRRCSISTVKYISEEILVACSRNPLNTVVIVLGVYKNGA